MCFIAFLNFIIRNGCAIVDGDSVVFTGGDTLEGFVSTVSRYNSEGWVEDLPSLGQARARHACAGYFNMDGIRVISILII